MRIPSALSTATVGVVGVVLGVALLTGCGATPGSVSGDPLAQKLFAAEQQMSTWDGGLTEITFGASATPGGTTLPCMRVLTAAPPSQSFTLQLNKKGGSSSYCPEVLALDTHSVIVHYADGVLYVADPSARAGGTDQQCRATFTGHQVSGDLAQKFLSATSQQTKMAGLLKAATAISGSDTRIELELDPATVAEMGTSTLPSGADADDFVVTAVADLDPAGALSALRMTVRADKIGTITVDANYAHTTDRPAIPEKSCTRTGSPFTTQSQIESVFS